MVYQLYFDGAIDQNEFCNRYNPLKQRSRQIELEIPRMQGELDALKISYLSSDLIITEAKDLYSRWPKLDFEEKRNIVENITDNIIVGKEDITINLFYLPSTHPSKEGANKLGTAQRAPTFFYTHQNNYINMIVLKLYYDRIVYINVTKDNQNWRGNFHESF
jgi:site-specific DNA recombinase